MAAALKQGEPQRPSIDSDDAEPVGLDAAGTRRDPDAARSRCALIPANGGTLGPHRIPFSYAGLFGAFSGAASRGSPRGRPNRCSLPLSLWPSTVEVEQRCWERPKQSCSWASRSAYRMLGMVSPVKTRPIRLHVMATSESQEHGSDRSGRKERRGMVFGQRDLVVVQAVREGFRPAI